MPLLLLDICAATMSPGAILAQAVLEAVAAARNQGLPLGWKHASRNLSQSERDSLRHDTIEKFLDILRTLPPEKEFEAAARAGEAKRGWYAASAKSLMDVFGADTPRFVGLLASLSPQVSVTTNFRNAIRFWEKWIEHGRPMTEKGLDEVGTAALGPMQWKGVEGVDRQGNPTKKGGMAAWRNNSLKVMSNPNPEKVILASGGTPTNPHIGKVDSFRANLLGDLSRVTNDAWMAHFGNIDQELFSTKQGYLAMTARVRAVAKKMGWEPAEVQETVWSFFKALTEKQNKDVRGKKALELMTHKDVAGSLDFNDLMTQDKEINDALERLRAQGLVGRPSPGLRAGGEGPAGSPLTSGSEGGLAGSLARITARAKNIRDAEDYQTNSTIGYHFPKATDIRWDRRRVTFTLTDPREIAEWREKPRKPTDTYQAAIGGVNGKWNVVKGVMHGTPTVADHQDKITITLPFREREQMGELQVDPERWRAVERKKHEAAHRFMTQAKIHEPAASPGKQSVG